MVYSGTVTTQRPRIGMTINNISELSQKIVSIQ